MKLGIDFSLPRLLALRAGVITIGTGVMWPLVATLALIAAILVGQEFGLPLFDGHEVSFGIVALILGVIHGSMALAAELLRRLVTPMLTRVPKVLVGAIKALPWLVSRRGAVGCPVLVYALLSRRLRPWERLSRRLVGLMLGIAVRLCGPCAPPAMPTRAVQGIASG